VSEWAEWDLCEGVCGSIVTVLHRTGIVMTSRALFIAPCVFALLSACSDKAADLTDADADGSPANEDCNDEDPLVYPDAVEVCDGVDTDCNGLIDDGATTDWYLDGDGDGVGVIGTPINACEAPAGYVDVSGDCDDAAADVYPDAPELCNERDDNCDGAADDGEGSLWYVDADGDGYGDDANALEYCSDPPGLVEVGGDCDDTDAGANPDQEEVCGDNDDDDCDGIPDVGVETVYYSDDDGDGYGSPGTYETTCEPQEGWVDQGGDCRPAEADKHPGAVELCNDLDDDCDGSIDEDMDVDGDGYRNSECPDGDDCDDTDPDINPGVRIDVCEDGIDNDCTGSDSSCGVGFSGTYSLGSASSHIYSDRSNYIAGLLMETGDPTGDGVTDVLVSTLYADGYGGAGYVIEGPISGTDTLENAGHRLYGTASATYGAGRSIGMADVTGDGVDDVGFGAPYGSYAGMYIEFGPITGDRALTSPDAWLECKASTYCGHGGNLGDIDGDGVADAVIGAYYDHDGASAGGAVYVVHGPITGDVNLSTDATKILGNVASSYTGRFVQIEGDFDGDGLGDALVAAPYATGSAPYSGVVYVLSGPISITSMSDATARLLGPGASGYLGEGAPMAGADVDLDGYSDAAVGSYTTASRSSAGGAYIVFGPISGDITLSTASDLVIEGQTSSEHAGSCIAFGDNNGDGAAELVVGASANSTSASGGGAAYLFVGLAAGTYTTADADASFYGTKASAYAGSSCGLADVNDDDRADVVVGAYYDSTGASAGGGVFIQYSD
jgi:Putative metal-binding motif